MFQTEDDLCGYGDVCDGYVCDDDVCDGYVCDYVCVCGM